MVDLIVIVGIILAVAGAPPTELLLLVDFLSCSDGVFQVDRHFMLTRIIITIRARLLVSTMMTLASLTIPAPVVILHVVIDILIELDLYLVVVDHPILVVLVLIVRFLVVRATLHLVGLLR